MKPKKIFFHVGHGKTGSSYLQSALALSTEKLKSHGIDYPEHPSFANARLGQISSGNLFNVGRWIANLVEKAEESTQETILYSNEALLYHILRYRAAFAPALAVHNVKIILFIRDPLDHMLSCYGQSIKRSFETNSVGQFSENYKMVERVGEFIDFCTENGYEVEVINYTKEKRHLIPAFERALGIPEGSLELPASRQVNRSLTASELEVQRLFNVHFGGKSSKFVSDVLCNRLPDIIAEKVQLSQDSKAGFLRRISPDVDKVNTKLEPHCRYSLPLDMADEEEDTKEVFMFSREQLEVMVKSICTELNTAAGAEKR